MNRAPSRFGILNPLARRFFQAAGRALASGPRAVGRLVGVSNGVFSENDGATLAPSRARQAAHALVVLLLWLPALVLAVMGLIVLTRGLLYGLVIDDGGWVDAWGGPSLVGAWIVHALIGIPLAALAGLGLVGIDALLDRADRRLLDRNGPAWIYPVAVLLAAFSALFLNAWLAQA